MEPLIKAYHIMMLFSTAPYRTSVRLGKSDYRYEKRRDCRDCRSQIISIFRLSPPNDKPRCAFLRSWHKTLLSIATGNKHTLRFPMPSGQCKVAAAAICRAAAGHLFCARRPPASFSGGRTWSAGQHRRRLRPCHRGG